MDKRWNILTADPVQEARLQQALKINPVLCSVLVRRGIDDFEKARKYFRPCLSELHDPFLMKDMDKAVERILRAISDGEKILVFGDYDVDGTTAVACMYQFLCRVHRQEKIEYYIPHRYREGYGVSRAGIDYADANDFPLIISLDCGIKSTELVAYARSRGIDFIICDHHLPDPVLPPAVAILNAKQPGCNYPYKELCGCGVGFKLITALAPRFGLGMDAVLCYLDLVATAIAADIVPMTGENRILVYHGLQRINSKPCAGIKALIARGGIQKALDINNVVFVIAPRINAAGRMDDGRKAVQLFIQTEHEKAGEFADMLHGDNSDRKEADMSITQEALSVIDGDEALINRKTTVVYREHWHKGVVGIVASRLTEKYYRPTVVLTRFGDIVTGSARSVAGFNLYEAVHACREHLIAYGGHFAAAGLSMLPDKVEAFSHRFEQEVCATIPDHLLVPEITIDAVVSFADLTDSFYRILCQMEPFGPGNMRPVFMATQVVDTGHTKLVKEQHIRFVLRQGERTLTGIGFNMVSKMKLVETGQPMDIVFTVDQNEWNGQTTLQIKVLDVKLTKLSIPELQNNA